MYLIDTCIFLEILLDQGKSAECEAFLSKIKTGKIKGHLSSFSLHSIEVILSRFNKIAALEMFLEEILTAENLDVVYTDLVDELKIVRSLQNKKLDIDDGIQYYLAKTKNLKLVSFDKDFDKTDIKRFEPHMI